MTKAHFCMKEWSILITQRINSWRRRDFLVLNCRFNLIVEESCAENATGGISWVTLNKLFLLTSCWLKSTWFRVKHFLRAFVILDNIFIQLLRSFFSHQPLITTFFHLHINNVCQLVWNQFSIDPFWVHWMDSMVGTNLPILT